MKVLFCCHGNINRSPAGEIILRTMEPTYEVKSCALKETKGGQITARKMRDTLIERFYVYDELRSTPISQELVDWADIIFYMDKSNRDKLEDKFGPSIFEKAKLIGSYIGVNKIPDPAFAKGTDIHHQVITLLENALEKWITEKNQIVAKPL